ncbi:YwmB family TATA-box binding protein [Paenibacillus sp. ACRRY]|uniref:YwmB family TATA-box binding protein n=1 Tax=Paenibacillus sp. ACRRY TaxID=2918208 RepID=UPI001EF66224|nr:YwmB family TATA-box binding protein [Paenibacillus sp. ACRRY]MCG7385240.1 YwmB family TATA-box binding protein [Paenibacillus sp. ACRRY]
MLNRWMTAGIVAMALIIVISMTKAYAGSSESEGAKLEQLIHTSNVAMDQVERMIIKWQGQGTGSAEEQAARLSEQLGLPQPVLGRQTGHDVYRSEVQAEGERAGILVNAVVTGENGYYVIVQLAGNRSTELSELISLHEQVDQLLAGSEVGATWNLAVQGRGTTDASVSNQLEEMEAKLSGQLGMHAAERYTDDNTASVSYRVPELPTAIQSGSDVLNMQIAVHQDQDKGSNRITLGFPVITIEY